MMPAQPCFMFVLYSVEGRDRRFKLSRGVIVGILVGIAVYTNIRAFQRVAEIRRNIAFQEQLKRGLDELSAATEEIAAKRRPQAE